MTLFQLLRILMVTIMKPMWLLVTLLAPVKAFKSMSRMIFGKLKSINIPIGLFWAENPLFNRVFFNCSWSIGLMTRKSMKIASKLAGSFERTWWSHEAKQIFDWGQYFCCWYCYCQYSKLLLQIFLSWKVQKTLLKFGQVLRRCCQWKILKKGSRKTTPLCKNALPSNGSG